jgi:hypothetical protein
MRGDREAQPPKTVGDGCHLTVFWNEDNDPGLVWTAVA